MQRVGVLVFWLAVWWLLSAAFNLERTLLPDFESVAGAFVSMITAPWFYGHVFDTLMRLFPGLVVSLTIGVPLGLGLAKFAVARIFVEPLVTLVRGVPVASLFPVAILLFGIGDGARAALTIYVALPIVVTATLSGAVERAENRIRRDYLRLHARELHWTDPLLCLLWDSMPAVVGGVRVATGMALVVIIVSEMFFVGGSGLGWYTWDQYQSFNFSNMYASILFIGLLSLTLDHALLQLTNLWGGNRGENVGPTARNGTPR